MATYDPDDLQLYVDGIAKSLSDLNATFERFSLPTGAITQSISLLSEQILNSAIQIEALDKSLKKLTNNVDAAAEAQSKTATGRDATGKTTNEEIFHKASDAIEGMNDKIKALNFNKFSAAMDLFNFELIRTAVTLGAVTSQFTGFTNDTKKNLDSVSEKQTKTVEKFSLVMDETHRSLSTKIGMALKDLGLEGSDLAKLTALGPQHVQTVGKESAFLSDEAAKAIGADLFEPMSAEMAEKLENLSKSIAKGEVPKGYEVVAPTLNISDIIAENKSPADELDKTSEDVKQSRMSLRDTLNSLATTFINFMNKLKATNISPTAGIIGAGVNAAYKASTEQPRMGLDALIGKNLTNSMEGIGKVIDGSLNAFKQFTKYLSLASVTVAFFVRQFNPAIFENFMQTMRDLSALIGAGMQPILSALTVVFRALADSLMPIVDALGPAFNSLGNMIVKFLVPIFMAFTKLLARLQPVINAFMVHIEFLSESFGNLIATIVTGLVPILEVAFEAFNIIATILEPVIAAFVYLADYVMPLVSSYLIGFGIMLAVDAVAALATFLAAVIQTATSLEAISALATGGLSVAIPVVVGFLTWLASKVSKFFAGRGSETGGQFGLTGASTNLAARRAEYTNVEDLSRNLIKASFAGGANDRLKSIDNNGKRQVELLEKIAGERKAPAVVPAGPAPGARV